MLKMSAGIRNWLLRRSNLMIKFPKAAVSVLSLLLAYPSSVPAAEPQVSATPVNLKIVVLQGEGAVNNIKTRTVTEPVVEVRDERDLPVAGADVVFQLPALGPGGVFPDHTRAYKTQSNAQGQAGTPALIPDSQPGRFSIRVTAMKGSQTANFVMSQQNSVEMITETHHGSRRWKIVAAAVGAAALGVGLYFVLRGGSTPNSISVTSGAITVGGPQ
jgi:hypothetical protein